MQLIIGISNDLKVSTGKVDDMSWLGGDDKKAFKLLTLGANKTIGVSLKTFMNMPFLPGRTVVPLSRKLCYTTLHNFVMQYPNGVLIGGQTLALEALKHGLITRAHLCYSEFDAPYNDIQQEDELTPIIEKWNLVAVTKLSTCTIKTFDK